MSQIIHQLIYFQLTKKSTSPRGIIYSGNLNKPQDSMLGAAENLRRGKFLSPNKTPDRNFIKGNEKPDLKGLVKIKAYEMTEELPTMVCNLQATQLDHLKVLVCEQEDKNHPKLTISAQTKFENEKQNQIKQYMEDIIQKLQQKERKFKVTVKRKFVDDALYNSTQLRVASVYVIVINREKTYDPLINQKQLSLYQLPEKQTNQKTQQPVDHSSSEDEHDQNNQSIIEPADQPLPHKLKDAAARRSANPNLINLKKKSMYESDYNFQAPSSAIATTADGQSVHSVGSSIPVLRKIAQEKIGAERLSRSRKGKNSISIGPSGKRAGKKADEEINIGGYRYTHPVKEYNKPPAKIKIFQDTQAHSHQNKNPLNIFFNQYNEFVRLVFKNQKTSAGQYQTQNVPKQFNPNYAHGLARALGLNLKKDAFIEQNLKSREHINTIKEKLIFAFWKKIIDSNKDLNPQAGQTSTIGSSTYQQTLDGTSHISDGEVQNDQNSFDSQSNANNTPKSKALKAKREDSNENNLTGSAMGAQICGPLMLPPASICYKYFIGKGNNSIMVRSLFKNRFWWVQHDKMEIERINFLWTQIKVPNIMEALPCKFPNKKSGIKNVTYSNQPSSMSVATPQQKSSKKKSSLSNSAQPASDKAMKRIDVSEPPVGINQVLSAMDPGKFTETKMYNKIEDNFHLNNKKALYINMKNYYEALGQDVFANIPLTFHIKTGLDDPEFHRFRQTYQKFEEEIKNKKQQQKLQRKAVQDKQDDDNLPCNSPEKGGNDEPQLFQTAAPQRNIWIIKPGENTNRGHGIQVAKDFDEIKSIIEESTTNGRRTCIVQKYIHNPLLISRRKFDIRTYVLFTSVNGNHKMYVYEEGYLRTTSREYSIANLSNKLLHLTNDAVQKKAEDYGKFEPGNKLSYNEFQGYLDKNFSDLNIVFDRDIRPQMNKLTTDIFRAVYLKLDPKRRLNCMEVFGLDFMIDDEFRSYVIEVNTNPCLELSSPLLARLIPNMLENALKIGMDSQFLPPEGFSSKKGFIGDPCPENRFELVFDSKIDGPVLDSLFKAKADVIMELDEDDMSDEEEEHDEVEE